MLGGFIFNFLICILSILLSLFKAATFSDLELRHFFGVRHQDYVKLHESHAIQKYAVNETSFLIVVPYNGRKYRFLINSDHGLIDRKNLIIQENDQLSDDCIYNGYGLDNNYTRIALTGCGDRMSGMIIIDNNETEFIFIQPHMKNNHIIHKRFAPSFHEETVCVFDAEKDPYRNVRPRNDRLTILNHNNKPIVVELALFVDEKLWRHFSDLYGSQADQELKTFIVATVNNINLLYNHKTIDPKPTLKIVRFEVMKIAPAALDSTVHQSGDVDLLLDAFCLYQNNLNTNGKKWDHALLFSGYDLYRGKVNAVAGYAPVKGMCSGIRSCTINEGIDFGSIFVITHEMGHNLGMYHDGDNGCDVGCCIMSPSLGNGKTRWSRCSANEFEQFFDNMGSNDFPPQCLLDTPISTSIDPPLDVRVLPGQRYNLDQQCRIFHGDCWHHELKDGQSPEDVCSMVWCGEDEGLIRTAHPALEGTYCSPGMWCVQGDCVPYGSLGPSATDGQWSAWNDHPKADCGGECSTCKIEGQLRVKRSIRFCDKPAPNYGGSDCPGSPFRGVVCSAEKCRGGASLEDYATSKCLGPKSSGAPTLVDLLFYGSGFQYKEAPCKVWCRMGVTGYIRSIGSYPDGAPCGSDKYCIKGRCTELACDGRALVAANDDCMNTAWSQWSVFTSCSATCGPATRSRQRSCSGCNDPQIETLSCDLAPCQQVVNQWTGWSQWSSCSATCGVDGQKFRSRRCYLSSFQPSSQCIGESSGSESCNTNVPCSLPRRTRRL